MFNVSDGISKIKALNYRDLLIFIIPLAIFSYYLHVFAPGLMVFDSYNQLHQIATGEFTNWHPFFHTFIEMMCLKVYRSPASVAVLQIITFSAFWMIICKFNRDDAQKSNRTFALQVAITLIISLIPINAIFSINLQKDILFSYLLMFLCFLMEVLIDKRGNVGYSFALVISVVMAFIAQLRQNGMILVIVLLFVLAIWLYIRNRNSKLYAIIPVLTVAFILVIASLNIVYDVEDHQNEALKDIVTHMLADYELNLDLDSADQAKLDKLISKKDLKKYYNVYWKDPTRDHIVHKSAWKKDRAAYVGMAIKYSLMHPKHFAKYLLKSAPIVWDITRESGWSKANGVVYITDSDSQRGGFYNKRNTTPVTDFDNASAANKGTPEYEALNGIADFAKDNLLFDTLFNSPALYMYLAIIVLVILYMLTRLRDLWLVYLPNLLNIGIVFVSIPAQLNRYLYPNLLVFYLLIIILVGVLMKRKTESFQH